MFEWHYTAGWTLQSDTKNMFPSLCLSISSFILCLSSLVSPHRFLPPSSCSSSSCSLLPPSSLLLSPLLLIFFLNTANSRHPLKAGVNNNYPSCCNWCHYFNLRWLQWRAACAVTRGWITHRQESACELPRLTKLNCGAAWLNGWTESARGFLVYWLLMWQ